MAALAPHGQDRSRPPPERQLHREESPVPGCPVSGFTAAGDADRDRPPVPAQDRFRGLPDRRAQRTEGQQLGEVGVGNPARQRGEPVGSRDLHAIAVERQGQPFQRGEIRVQPADLEDPDLRDESRIGGGGSGRGADRRDPRRQRENGGAPPAAEPLHPPNSMGSARRPRPVSRPAADAGDRAPRRPEPGRRRGTIAGAAGGTLDRAAASSRRTSRASPETGEAPD